MARVLSGLAVLARLGGDEDHGWRLAIESLAIMEDLGDVLGVIGAVEVVAALAVAAGRPEMAARLAAASDAGRARFGCPRPPVAEPDHEHLVTAVREALGEEELARAWQEGSRLSPTEAAAYARRGRGRRGRPSKGWDSLSPAERDVASLVAEGLTNAEVGARLFISPRTVGTHLHHAYAKLEVNSRRELARVVREQGATSPTR